MVKLTGESFRFGIFLKLMVYNSVTVCFSDKFLQHKFIWVSYYRVFQIAIRGGGWWESEILLGGGGAGFFYRVKETWGGVISTIWFRQIYENDSCLWWAGKLCTCGNTTLVQIHTVRANSKVFLKYVVSWDWLLVYPLYLNFGLTNLQKSTRPLFWGGMTLPD